MEGTTAYCQGLNASLAALEPKAEWLLSTSDVEPYLLVDLLALADEPTRTLWEGLALG